MNLVLPASTASLLARVPNRNRHPGLQLDKFSVAGDQTTQRDALNDVCAVAGDPALLAARRNGWRSAWSALPGAISFSGATVSPLTLHLARASALENAGICLHPLYGFAYLPGSGLKGMARAFAEMVWLPDQPESERPRAWEQIEDVFGWASTPDRRKQIDDREHPAHIRRQRRDDPDSPEIKSSSGGIVFHDAWPAEWPQLLVDIVNNHHSDYYTAAAPDNVNAPGDWEDPIPVYFLAVTPGAKFDFVVSKRRDDVPDALRDLAQRWLAGALSELGAGAKTAAGYGNFKVAAALRDGEPAIAQSGRASPPQTIGATFETTLELVTPAFLAGASQEAADCDLRGATLRGHLRWWWRTMHAGFVDVATLRQMEAAVWGDTKRGSAVRVVIEQRAKVKPFERPGKKLGKDRRGNDALDNDREFLKKNGIDVTTQGLFYAAYGTDEMVQAPGGRWRKRRWCVAASSEWNARLIASPTKVPVYKDGKLSHRVALAQELILRQSLAALWLFCQFGGAGAKSRKGFGSFANPANLQDWNLSRTKRSAQDFRDFWKAAALPFQTGVTGTPALEQAELIERQMTCSNAWSALDKLGAAMQSFAQAPPATKHGKHCAAKAALGLPRKIHGPLEGRPIGHQTPQTHQNPVELRGPKGDRHAAPVFYHFGRGSDNRLIFRAAIFRTDYLYDANKNAQSGRAEARQTLDALAAHLKDQFAEDSAVGGGTGSPPRRQGARGALEEGSQWEKILVVYRARIGQSHLIELPDGQKARVQFGTPPSPLPTNGQTTEIYRQRSGARECRWQPPGAAAGR